MQVETKQILGVPCPNCGKLIKMYKPQVSGRYNIHCKACGIDCWVDIPEKLTEKVVKNEKEPEKKEPEKKANNFIVLCSHCKSKIRMDIPAKAGIYKLHCKLCGKDFAVKVPQKLIDSSSINISQSNGTQTNTSASAGKDANTVDNHTKQLDIKGCGAAVVVRKRFLLSDKIYPLRDGANTIGMKDEHLSSDIMIDDKAISRRSVTLTSERLDNGKYRYLFTLKRTTNPVRLNGKEVAVGTSLYIEPDTVIELGRTKLTLKMKP